MARHLAGQQASLGGRRRVGGGEQLQPEHGSLCHQQPCVCVTSAQCALPPLLRCSACHIWGERPYNTGDLSSNVWWLALATFGEAW